MFKFYHAFFILSIAALFIIVVISSVARYYYDKKCYNISKELVVDWADKFSKRKHSNNAFIRHKEELPVTDQWEPFMPLVIYYTRQKDTDILYVCSAGSDRIYLTDDDIIEKRETVIRGADG